MVQQIDDLDRRSINLLGSIPRGCGADALATKYSPGAGPAGLARAFLRLSALRAEVLGVERVTEASWNMLLDLYADDELHRKTFVSSLSLASGAPQSTGLRQIRTMQKQGLIEIESDQHDGRCCTVCLTATTRRNLQFYFELAIERIERAMADQTHRSCHLEISDRPS